ncbi:ABC transporter ATP-binding protein [Fundidesulfovibrio butyratiphilus]
METPLLTIRELSTAFFTAKGQALAVDSVSLALAAGEILGLVGESGCGKTVLSLSVLGLVEEPGRVLGGHVLFDGRDLRTMSPAELRRVRGAGIGMIFQEPMTSLNPVMRVGDQVGEPLRAHAGLSARRARRRAVELLAEVGLPDPERAAACFPHELSGGMRQRAMIAMALSCRPRLLIADEPTTALDVTVQKQILDLMVRLVRANRTAMLLITHNLGVVAQTCDRVGVMYSGRVVEESPVEALFREPLHPYTVGLLASVPRLGRRERLTPVAGMVPAPTDLPAGCHFHPRCPRAFAPCAQKAPPVFTPSPGRFVRCWLHQ